jgi:hypothetical protein
MRDKDGNKKGLFSKVDTKKIKLKLSEFEITNLLCKLLRTDNEFTRKLKKFILKVVNEKTD